MTTRQLPLFGARRTQRACFFDLRGGKDSAKFSAYTPKAVKFFSEKYSLAVVTKPEDLAAFDVVFFSLHCFRDFYRVATQTQAVMIGDYLAARTDAQLQVAFGLTAAQVTALRSSKLTPAATAAATVRATTGA